MAGYNTWGIPSQGANLSASYTQPAILTHSPSTFSLLYSSLHHLIPPHFTPLILPLLVPYALSLKNKCTPIASCVPSSWAVFLHSERHWFNPLAFSVWLTVLEGAPDWACPPPQPSLQGNPDTFSCPCAHLALQRLAFDGFCRGLGTGCLGHSCYCLSVPSLLCSEALTFNLMDFCQADKINIKVNAAAAVFYIALASKIYFFFLSSFKTSTFLLPNLKINSFVQRSKNFSFIWIVTLKL